MLLFERSHVFSFLGVGDIPERNKIKLALGATPWES